MISIRNCHYFSDITTEEPCNTLTKMDYLISVSVIKTVIKALVDEGANGGIRGKDMKLIGYNCGV